MGDSVCEYVCNVVFTYRVRVRFKDYSNASDERVRGRAIGLALVERARNYSTVRGDVVVKCECEHVGGVGDG